jgi:hypothetical protein
MSEGKKETFGQVQIGDEDRKAIVAIFTVVRDEREVSVCEADDGTYVVATKSWLRQNNRELVQTVNVYTKETFVMMLEAMLLGAEYMGLNVGEESSRLHASDGHGIKFEYAGRGEPAFNKGQGDEK